MGREIFYSKNNSTLEITDIKHEHMFFRKKVMKLVQTKREGATKNIPASDVSYK